MPRQPATCKETALGALARREHSVGELGRKLRQKGFGLAEVRQVVEALQADGYVDNARYAVARVRYRALQSKWGWGRIVQELKMAGVGEDDIAAARGALAEEGIDLQDGAVALARRKLAGKVEDAEARFKQRQKALAALVRKGFSLDEAKRALDEAAAEG
ncbi:MAG: regulatory protein RecX [Pseudomonadaceae bacterium]|nr:regulatory protein RecX [Pseudomonadaceae bacterium]